MSSSSRNEKKALKALKIPFLLVFSASFESASLLLVCQIVSILFWIYWITKLFGWVARLKSNWSHCILQRCVWSITRPNCTFCGIVSGFRFVVEFVAICREIRFVAEFALFSFSSIFFACFGFQYQLHKLLYRSKLLQK